MCVQKLKKELGALPKSEQDEVIAYLFHLRPGHDKDYQDQIYQARCLQPH